MVNAETKFVDFATWCSKCLHSTKNETCDPCNECMSEPVNEYSHKPVLFEPIDSQEKHKV